MRHPGHPSEYSAIPADTHQVPTAGSTLNPYSAEVLDRLDDHIPPAVTAIDRPGSEGIEATIGDDVLQRYRHLPLQ